MAATVAAPRLLSSAPASATACGFLQGTQLTLSFTQSTSVQAIVVGSTSVQAIVVGTPWWWLTA